MKSLGSRLKEAREKKRYTQLEVAKKLGISNGTLSGYERDYRDPDTDTLRKLASLYEVSVDWLMSGQPKKAEQPDTKEKDPVDQLIEYLDVLELTDEEIMERLTFKVDDITLSKEEVKEFISFVRYERFKKRQQPAASRVEEL